MKTIILLGLIALISCASVPDAATTKQLLELHNIERRLIGLAELTWNATLAESSQAWANNLATNGGLKHSGTKGVGENLAKASFRKDLIAFLVGMWSNEKQNFDNSQKYPDCRKGEGKIGHYTQMIWGRTISVGCGIANTTKSSVLVCQYFKPGNYIGSWTYKPEEIINTPTTPTEPTEPTTPQEPEEPTEPTEPTTPEEPEEPSTPGVDFPTQMLALHNAERKQYNSPDLAWSDKLAKSAQEWADHLATKTSLSASDTSYGENLARESTDSKKDMVAYLFSTWSDQKKYFIPTQKYPKCTTGGNIDQYSQVLWHRSTIVGCGFAKTTKTGKYSILVCHYSKHGNLTLWYVVPQARRLRGEADEN